MQNKQRAIEIRTRMFISETIKQTVNCTSRFNGKIR